MRSGDVVKLVGIPPGLKDDPDFQTRSLFEKCLGGCFLIAEVESIRGLPHKLARIDIGHVFGEKSGMQSIWVEEQYLEIQR